MRFASKVGRWAAIGVVLVLLAAAPGAESAVVVDWELATPVPARYVRNPDVYPHFSAIFALDWLAVAATTEGRLELGEHLALPPEEPHTVLARAWLRSERWQSVKLSFACRDGAVVFWNGQPVYRGGSPGPRAAIPPRSQRAGPSSSLLRPASTS